MVVRKEAVKVEVARDISPEVIRAMDSVSQFIPSADKIEVEFIKAPSHSVINLKVCFTVTPTKQALSELSSLGEYHLEREGSFVCGVVPIVRVKNSRLF